MSTYKSMSVDLSLLSFSNSSNRAGTISLLVSSISPARKISSKMAYTCGYPTSSTWSRRAAVCHFEEIEDEAPTPRRCRKGHLRVLLALHRHTKTNFTPKTSTKRRTASGFFVVRIYANAEEEPGVQRYTTLQFRNQ